MNSLTSLYNDIKGFADAHKMVNEFFLVGSEDDINNLDLTYRSMIMIPLEANISRELNSPVYTLDFGIIVIDKYINDNSVAQILSSEENINVIGQLQDFLLQSNVDVNFQSIELTDSFSEDYNVSIAMTDFSVNLARGSYNRDINF